ncbi:MAG: hypothetical protein ACFFE8_13340 [Candidatus Heimdallarchaeota archaeon]
MGERIPQESHTTHIVFFNYSLCCLPSLDKMIGGLDEAWRVLKPGGLLVNFYPFIVPVQLFAQTHSTVSVEVPPYTQGMGFDESYTFKNAVILRGFQVVIEEKITLNSFYRSEHQAMKEILPQRSIKYLGIDQCLNFGISKLIGKFVTNREKPEWFLLGKDDEFTLVCQIFMKKGHMARN